MSDMIKLAFNCIKMKIIWESDYMIQKLKSISLLVLIASLFPTGVSAQSLHPLHQYGERDMRSSINLTIPLGGKRNAATSKPQINLSFQQHRVQQHRYNFSPSSLDVNSSAYNLQPRQARIGFTLDQSPQLMMNGKPHQLPEGTSNASTLGKVGIGAAALVGIGVLVVGTGLIIIASSDSSDE